MPVRFQQRRRIKSKPNPEARCVSRVSRWGNPFDWRIYGHATAVAMYSAELFGDKPRAERKVPTCDEARRELRGRDLGCYCGPEQAWCHANVLLEVANR